MKHYSLIFICHFGWLLNFGQSIFIEGSVVDSMTKKPIPFVNIAVNNGEWGTFSNECGIFQLKVKPGDSLTFSSVGYFTIKKTESSIREVIYLKESSTLLEEITISSSKNNVERHSYGFSNFKKHGVFRNMKQAGLFIENDFKRSGYIKNITFLVSNRLFNKVDNSQRKDYKVRVRVLKLTELGNPGDDLDLGQNVIFDIEENQKKLKVTFKNHSLIFPKEGCFLVIEFLGFLNEEKAFVPFNDLMKDNFHFAPVFSKNHDSIRSWQGNGEYWEPIEISIGNEGYINFNFGAVIEYN